MLIAMRYLHAFCACRRSAYSILSELKMEWRYNKRFDFNCVASCVSLPHVWWRKRFTVGSILGLGFLGAATRLANRCLRTEYLQQGRAVPSFACRRHRRMDVTDQIRCIGRSRPLRMPGTFSARKYQPIINDFTQTLIMWRANLSEFPNIVERNLNVNNQMMND